MSETVPSLELTLLLIGVPAVSWAVGAFVILEGVSDIRARDPIAIPAGATARLVQYFAITATAPIFGLIPWLMVSGIEDNFGSPSAPVAALLDALGVAFAWTAVVATGTQAWITRVRLRLFVGLDFGRVLPLVVVPSTVVIFGLVLSFLVLGRVEDSAGWAPLTVEGATRMGTALLVYSASTTAVAVSSFVAGRVRDLRQMRNFVRAVSMTDSGVLISILALAWAFSQITSV